MQRIPIIAEPNQIFSITLGGQQCRIQVRQLTTGVYLDLWVGSAKVLSTSVCRDRVRLIRYEYIGFTGNLAFIDTQGATDPEYGGFGTRYQLVYIP